MSAPIGPGDWVEVIQPDSDMPRGQGPYCVECFTEPSPCSSCPDCGPGFELIGVTRSPAGWSFCRCELRPIYRPRAETFRSLLHPAPEREAVDA